MGPLEMTLREYQRFMDKVQIGGDTECWMWTASTKDGKYPYGMFGFRGRTRRAHQLSYEMFVGDRIPGMHLDHLCREPRCVNPDHLEQVTHGENLRRGNHRNGRKTHCKRGHEFTPENTYVGPKGNRFCRECHRTVLFPRWKAKQS